jgi:FixJ family two-component response regulator
VSIPPADSRDVVDRYGRVVILVEDDEGRRLVLERMLRAFGFEAQAYGSAEAALANHSQDWADCMVVDLNLPKMSGLDLVDCLRGRGVSAPAVVITGDVRPCMRAEVRRRGIKHLLAKPFPGGELVRLLDDVIAANSNGAGSGQAMTLAPKGGLHCPRAR